MVTHPGFGIITQEIDQHQEEIQVNYFQSILQLERKTIKCMSSKEYLSVLSYYYSCCQIDFSFIK